MMAPGRFVFLCLVLLLGVCYGQPPQSDAGTGLVAGSLGLGLITLAGLSASNAVLAGQVQNLRRNCNAADCSDCEEKLKKCLEEKERIQKDLIETENDLEEAKETIDLQTTTIQNLNQQVADAQARFNVAIQGIGFLCEINDAANAVNCLRCARLLDDQSACEAESNGIDPICTFDTTEGLCRRATGP